MIRDLGVDVSNLPRSAAYCVVGGGIAGLLLATKLARGRNSVIVLESGGLDFEADIHDLNIVDDPLSRYSRELTGRYRGLGGSSSRWGGRMIPISPHDQGRREYLSLPAWPVDLETLDRYEHELEDLFRIGHDSFDDIEKTRPGVSGILASDTEDLLARWAKCPSFARCNLVNTLGEELRSNPYVTVILHATVTDFQVDREKRRLRSLTAKSLGGNVITVSADEFALAAGAIESTRLLLLLDAGCDHKAFAGTDALGMHFQDHLKAEVAVVDRQRARLTNHLLGYRFISGARRDLHLELSPDAQAEEGVGSGFVYVSMDIADSGLGMIKSVAQSLQRGRVEVPQLRSALGNFGLLSTAAYWRLRFGQLYVPPEIDFRMMVCVEQLPDRNNRISLSQKTDPFGMRKARIEWTPREADERTFQSTINHLARYWQRSGYGELCPLIWNKSVTSGAPIIERAEACAHPSGTTRMGTDPSTSVVSPDLRCHAIPNLAVASSSTFPTAGSANPTLTIMKLALRLADHYMGSNG